jgi:hypothetical protein
MKAIVRTKSNYKNANGKELKVLELLNTIIALEVPEFGFDKNGEPVGKMITADFSMKEVISLIK